MAGLNYGYDLVCIKILGCAEVPSLNETISLVCAEESRRGIMLDTLPPASSAILSSKPRGLTLDKVLKTRAGLTLEAQLEMNSGVTTAQILDTLKINVGNCMVSQAAMNGDRKVCLPNLIRDRLV